MIKDLEHAADLLTRAQHDANLLMQSLASDGEEAVPAALYNIGGLINEAISILDSYQPDGEVNAQEDH